jgi:membrane protein DedA with SNARE-associated domain
LTPGRRSIRFSLLGSLVEVVTTVMTTIGIPGLLALMVVEGFGLPSLPSEVILPFAGFLIADGTFSFGWALAAALGGTLIGSYTAYAFGRGWRHRITGRGVGGLRLEPRHLERGDRFFTRRGDITVAVPRLIPVIRSYISYPAGTARMEPVRFGVYTLVGATPFTVALIYAGMDLRPNWGVVRSYLSVLDIPLIALVVLAAGFLALPIVGVPEPGRPPCRAKGSVSGAPPSQTP